MMRRLVAIIATLGAAACTTVTPRDAAPPIEVQILAFNDFHGNLETPPPVEIADPDGTRRKIVSGGAAHLASALAGLRAGHPNTVTVSAGDTIGASPLISASNNMASLAVAALLGTNEATRGLSLNDRAVSFQSCST